MHLLLVRCSWQLRAFAVFVVLFTWTIAFMVSRDPGPLIVNSTGSPQLDALIAFAMYFVLLVPPVCVALLAQNSIQLEGDSLTVRRLGGWSIATYPRNALVAIRRRAWPIGDTVLFAFADGRSVTIFKYAQGLTEFLDATHHDLGKLHRAV